MYNSPVASNRLQGKFHNVTQEALAPGAQERQTAIGVLKEVYDQQKLSQVTLPNPIKEDIEAHPGLLFAKVLLDSDQEYILPFKETEDTINLTYGNYLQLEGRPIKVEYRGASIESGQIILQRNFSEKQINVVEETKTYDIGGVI